MSASQRPLFFQRRFLPMWTALSLGAFTDNMLKQALSIALVYGIFTAPIIGNDDALPIVGSLFPAAMLLFSTIAGQIADKYETSFMFRRTKFVEFVLMAIAAFGFITKNTSLLIIVLFLMGAQSAFFSPVRTSAMPKYLEANELVRGNALCGAGLFVSVMTGIFVGSILITQAGGPALVSAILVGASLIGWLAIRLAPEAAANDPGHRIDWNPFAQSRFLISYVLEARGVLPPLLGVAWYWTIGALISVTVPFFARDDLHADESVVATMMALFAVGAAIGSVAASAFAKGRSALGLSAFGIGLSGATTMILYLITLTYAAPAGGNFQNLGSFFAAWQGWAIALTFLIASVAASLFVVPLQAAVQRRATPGRRARILAANNMANAIGAIIGFQLVFFVTRTEIEARQIFFAVAIAQFALTAYMVRRRRQLPGGLYDEMLHVETNAADSE